MDPSRPATIAQSLERRLPATLESVAEARQAIRRFAGPLEVDLDGLVLAVSEAVANAVVHAYGGCDPQRHVELSAAALPDALTVSVRDRGGGMSTVSAAGAGFGLMLIRRLAEQVDLADSPTGVALTMRFRRGTGA